MRAFTSVSCIFALAIAHFSTVDGAGFADLLGPLFGGGTDSGGGLLTSILGPVSVVSGDFVGVDTKVGSPSTVIEKGGASNGGISVKGPTFVRVKTDIDSETTEIRTARSKATPASPAPPADTDPEIAFALAKPRPSSVLAATTALSSVVGSISSVFGGKEATPAPPAPVPTLPTFPASVLSSGSVHTTSAATAISPSTQTLNSNTREAKAGTDSTDQLATPAPQTVPSPSVGAVKPPDSAPRSLRG